MNFKNILYAGILTVGAAVTALLSGCATSQKSIDNAVLDSMNPKNAATAPANPSAGKPKDEKKADDVYVESIYEEGVQDSETSRVEFNRDGKRIFAAEHKHVNNGDDFVTAGLKQEINLNDIFKGEASIYGDEDSTDNSRLAFGWRGNLPKLYDLIFGGVIEKKSTAAEDLNLWNLYAGKKFGKLTLKAGFAEIDEKKIYQGTAMLESIGNNFLAVGGKVDEDGKGLVNAFARHYAQKKGEGIGWEVKANSDLEGMVTAKALFATNCNLLKTSAYTDFDDNGMNDLSKNTADFRAPFDCFYGNLVSTLEFTKDGDNKKYAVRTYKVLGDLGIFKNLTVGGGVTLQKMLDDGMTTYNGIVITDAGPISLYFEASKQEGKPTEYSIGFWLNVSDVAKCFGKGK